LNKNLKKNRAFVIQYFEMTDLA